MTLTLSHSYEIMRLRLSGKVLLDQLLQLGVHSGGKVLLIDHPPDLVKEVFQSLSQACLHPLLGFNI